jgi:hypothetical protein
MAAEFIANGSGWSGSSDRTSAADAFRANETGIVADIVERSVDEH